MPQHSSHVEFKPGIKRLRDGQSAEAPEYLRHAAKLKQQTAANKRQLGFSLVELMVVVLVLGVLLAIAISSVVSITRIYRIAGDGRGIAFATARLAAGATALRNMIVEAWLDSANTPIGYPMDNVRDIRLRLWSSRPAAQR